MGRVAAGVGESGEDNKGTGSGEFGKVTGLGNGEVGKGELGKLLVVVSIGKGGSGVSKKGGKGDVSKEGSSG